MKDVFSFCCRVVGLAAFVPCGDDLYSLKAHICRFGRVFSAFDRFSNARIPD